ncbi:MAG: alpha/beta hydrolase [Pyrinomonadaceae bacterium]
MSLLNSIAKIYVRLFFREDGDFDPLKTQRLMNVNKPPRSIARRCEIFEHERIRAFWIDRQSAKRGVLVYLHGGAFYFGPVKEHWEYIARISKQAGMAAIVVDYGLAPQNPFPNGLDEIIELVTKFDLSQKWFFLGDSSGAAMAISATFKLRASSAPMPSRLVLMSPWVDVTVANPDIRLNEQEDPMMSVKRLSNAAAIYVGDAEPTDPMISPLFGDLTGLPPILIQMGTADLLLADCRKFYQKCLEAGVDARYEEFPGAFHDFMMLNILPEARQALRSQAEFLTQ